MLQTNILQSQMSRRFFIYTNYFLFIKTEEYDIFEKCILDKYILY